MLLKANQTLLIIEIPMLLEMVKIKIRLVYFFLCFKTNRSDTFNHPFKKTLFFKWHNMEYHFSPWPHPPAFRNVFWFCLFKHFKKNHQSLFFPGNDFVLVIQNSCLERDPWLKWTIRLQISLSSTCLTTAMGKGGEGLSILSCGWPHSVLALTWRK